MEITYSRIHAAAFVELNDVTYHIACDRELRSTAWSSGPHLLSRETTHSHTNVDSPVQGALQYSPEERDGRDAYKGSSIMSRSRCDEVRSGIEIHSS